MSSTLNKPSIAVVIPVYNGEAYLSEAIESALAQTRPPAEIVILDDASSDGSSRIIDRYRAHPLVRIHRLETRVLAAAAWNRAIRLSSAEYFVLLAHDDRLHPRFLAEIASALNHSPDAGFVVTGYNLIDRLGTVMQGRPIRQPYLLGRTPFDVFFNEMVVVGRMYFRATSNVVARAVFDSLEGFDERFYGVFDYDFYIRVAGTTTTFGLEEPLVDYRMHPANISAEVFHDDKGDCDVIFRKLTSYTMLSDEQKQQLAQNVSLAQFHYLTRAVRSERFTLSEVHAVRNKVRDRLYGWACTGRPYAEYVHTHPKRFRQRLAWNVSATSAGISLLRTALRVSSRLGASD